MDRRRLLTGFSAAAGGLVLGGCEQMSASPRVRGLVQRAEGLTMRAQRLVVARGALAREFSRADISPDFRGNGTTNPQTPDYQAHAMAGFADWRLVVDGLVERPMALTLTQLRRLPGRTQITRHDCVEGWSSIGEWTGARLGPILERAGLRSSARYIVFHCADLMSPTEPYYESIDLIDAFHPQTILAYGMNGQPLPVKYGAPIRLRVERQLGYKHAKYVHRIEAVESYAHLGGGRGGYWEDHGYEWFAGI